MVGDVKGGIAWLPTSPHHHKRTYSHGDQVKNRPGLFYKAEAVMGALFPSLNRVPGGCTAGNQL